jgi:hypothetical protein
MDCQSVFKLLAEEPSNRYSWFIIMPAEDLTPRRSTSHDNNNADMNPNFGGTATSGLVALGGNYRGVVWECMTVGLKSCWSDYEYIHLKVTTFIVNKFISMWTILVS